MAIIFFIFSNFKYLLNPNLVLIGDQDDDLIEVPIGNTDILSYDVGYVDSNDEFVGKTLQVNAPCEYWDDDFQVKSRTWLTFNSYTANQ